MLDNKAIEKRMKSIKADASLLESNLVKQPTKISDEQIKELEYNVGYAKASNASTAAAWKALDDAHRHNKEARFAERCLNKLNQPAVARLRVFGSVAKAFGGLQSCGTELNLIPEDMRGRNAEITRKVNRLEEVFINEAKAFTAYADEFERME